MAPPKSSTEFGSSFMAPPNTFQMNTPLDRQSIIDGFTGLQVIYRLVTARLSTQL